MRRAGLLLLIFYILVLSCTSLVCYSAALPEHLIVRNYHSKSVNYYNQPSAFWLYNDTDAFDHLGKLLRIPYKKGQYFLIAQYIIPGRDSGGYAHGGVKDRPAFIRAVERCAKMIGKKPAIVIIEPDALCLVDSSQSYIAASVRIYRKNCPKAKLFIDIGNPYWLTPNEVIKRLKNIAISKADGIAINVASFVPTKLCFDYGDAIVKFFPGKKYIIDTSRNGGNSPAYPFNFDPPGIKIGEYPTFHTGNPNCFALLWIKPPGEADGRVAPPGTFLENLIER